MADRIFKDENEIGKTFQNLFPTKEQLEDPQFEEIFNESMEEIKEKLKQNLVIGFFGTASSGKDSALKALFGINTDEIHPIPGSTKDVKIFKIHKQIYILNAPGFGDIQREISDKAREVMEDVDIFVYLVNAEGGVTEQELYDYLELKKTGKDVAVVLNKIDLMKSDYELEELAEHTKESLEVDNKDFFLAAFDPHPRIMDKPYGTEAILNWLAEKLTKAGKELLFAKIVKEKDLICEKVIKKYVVEATIIGATPVPGSDIFFLLPLQIKMGAEIAKIYGKNINKQNIKQLIINILGANVAKRIYQMALSGAKALGWLPGGQLEEVIVCALAASIAASGTYGIGKALQFFYKNDMQVSLESVNDVFNLSVDEYKKSNPVKEILKQVKEYKSKELKDE